MLPNRVKIIGGKVIIFNPGIVGPNADTYSMMTCWDPATQQPCQGKWPVNVPSTAGDYQGGFGDLFPYRRQPDVDAGVCIGGILAYNPYPFPTSKPYCYKLDGNPIGMLDSNAEQMKFFVLSGDIYGTKYLFPSSSGVGCWNMATNSSCPNYPAYNLAPSSEDGGDRQYRTYTIRRESPTCYWANGDAGNIWNFDPRTGTY